MGAFRGRSLLFFGFVGEGEGGAVVCCCAVAGCAAPAVVGLLFCASPSRSLTLLCPLSFRCQGAEGGHDCDWLSLMLVSGVPAFRGGGILGSRVCGRYADSVMRGRFELCRAGRKEEKGHRCDLRQCAHRRVLAGCEAKRKMEVMGVAVARRVAMTRSL